jgi:SH3-like domain-containing protein
MLRCRFALVASLVAAANASAQQLATKRDVNLHEGPSNSSQIIKALDSGTVVDSLMRRSGWDRVQTSDGTKGWIYARFLEAASGAPTPIGPTSAPPPAAAADTAPQSFAGCPIGGNVSPNAPNVAALKALNLDKNRFTAPHDSDIDPSFTLANLLRPGADDERFDEKKAGELEGFVLAVKVGGIETVNCKATDPLHRDTHIEIALHIGDDSTKRVIVEVTPRWRAEMQSLGADWSTQGLQSLVGKRVRFRGWQLFDIEHRPQAKNTAPTNPKDWRATVWEIHPITSFKIVTP